MARRMAITKKHIPEGSAQLYGINLIYSRIIGQRFAISKSTVKNKIHIEIIGRSAPKATSVVIDGSTTMWAVHCPTQRTVQNLAGNVVSYVIGKTVLLVYT